MGEAANVSHSMPISDGYTVVAFVSISAFRALGLVYLIFDFFKRRRGLYFWSLLVTSVGTVIACVFCILFIFGDADTLIAAAATHGAGHWVQAVDILEKNSVVGYCVREMIILGFYAWATIRNLRPLIFLRGRKGSQLIAALIFAGIVSVILDTANMVMDFTVPSAIVAAFVPFIISTKLLVKFAALNKLIRFVPRNSNGECSYSTSTGDNSEHQQHARRPSFLSSQPLTTPDGVVLETKRSRSSDQQQSPGYNHHRTHTRDLPSIDGSECAELPTPPQIHSAEHLVRELPDLEAGTHSGESSSS
ncbi:hypothetical protein BO94DRAFT_315854 [Aspergillus sclerotioniger CBS 115572]|uniref:DUF7703 domain-containing protein n=1 Tax=Aspergillus sclerotioniger CBS 115572 TaxID=1450535 RepID=A0A317X5U1_9EURO|nr:hypothetical protein BO94DRAFT_315854 [Aspergillus sclerotioniger CBS 115572]PWY93974.1 hypothetical protein BO94DRAFT_315854 [Aspergillus sclerotioniger CBS 115572]